MGLYAEGWEGSGESGLKMGVMDPRLKFGGILPVSPIAENRRAISGAMQSLPILQTVNGRQPGPCEEEGVDLHMAEITSSVVMIAEPAVSARYGSIGWRKPALIALVRVVRRRSWEAGFVGLGAPIAA